MRSRVLVWSVLVICLARVHVSVGAEPPTESPAVSQADSTGDATGERAQMIRAKLLVPAYFYPSGGGLKYWKQLMSAAGKVPVIAIANPASGPGTRVDPNYTTVIRDAIAAKVQVIGYVSTSYAKRPIADVMADVDQWVAFYPSIQGIFFDEQTSSADQMEYYLALKRHTLTKIPKAFVVTNPGTECAEEYFAQNVADTICIIEKGAGLDSYSPPAWASKYPASRFYGLAYGIKKAGGMQASMKAAAKKQLGYVFVTDDVLDNPWDTLPGYWEAEVKAVK